MGVLWWALLGSVACGPGEETCASAVDGVCDEGDICALGSDSTDCDAGCEGWGGDASDSLAMACAHDGAAAEIEEPREPSASEGTGGPVGTWDGVVQVRGQRANDTVERHFRVYAPRRVHPDRATPVLFNLGGFTVDMYWLAEYTELDRAADLNDFIVVYGQPEWRNFNGTWVFAWYVYENAWNGGWEDNPDVAYLTAVLEKVAGLYNVDRNRVYASGHSRGAAMSVIAAFERPDLFAGFVAEAGFVSANNYDGRMEALAPSDRFGAWLLHGKQDPDVQVRESTGIANTLEGLGWEEGVDLVYRKLDGVTHEWQPQFNQDFWDFHGGLALESSP